ncbi:ABC-type dipeptide/oligopeptide/nickel transport system ATPase component/ABC-type dipeptide/oligopeptide/nickel transport system permease subunit [Microbacterium sp. SORGH_AS 1204]|uniref:dipeptide/oligopeptide/nickel ABC transporter permease/ATP-binding protein n=1 Tax=Microbacterium sp. SORGH_AS_1204 TaxID=3041785 RepID=UPI00279232BB|nr:dipeptide/oligopeptide/nickel ABC transporter permease/ATP-binding protein [Microbacterium sp. SORGH_AS_1204]MDQ1136305.1 ABC-type dipeptide/oligopeptide/nickel transport system ATPase component/ABC-type dipeptide/oligopeptide/nickel transport system permease subunit [Microbacterium sp. SORGH_AS_1204]
MPTAPGAVRRFFRNPFALIPLAIVAVLGLLSVLAPLVAPVDPNAVFTASVGGGPTSGHPLGFDASGRDVWSRLVYGGRTSLSSALIVVVIAVAFGTPVGLVAGYFRGTFERIASAVSDILQSVPAMILLLVIAAATSNNYVAVMTVLGVMFAPGFYRLTRSSVIAVRGELFIDAARVSGLTDGRIIARHVLGVVRGPLLVNAALSSGLAISIQGGLEFLGLGLPGVPSWGGMLNDAFKNIFSYPQLMIAPGIVMGVAIASLALIGSGVSDALSVSAVQARRTSRRGHAEASVGGRPESAVSVRGLRVSYGGREVVHGTDLDVRVDRVMGIVGESGSGKTQTAFAILGVLPPEAEVSAGALLVDGVDVQALSPSRRSALLGTTVGYIPQEPSANLDPTFTIGHQLTLPLRKKRGMSRATASAEAARLLARVGIVDPARTMRAYPHQISGGMAQRVLIAGAVSLRPHLLIADEPTTALDVTVQAEVLDLLRDLREEYGMALVVVTHNLGVVADICDEVTVMRAGEIVERGDVREVLTAPRSDYTRALLAASLEGMPDRRSRDRDAARAGVPSQPALSEDDTEAVRP